MFCLNGVSSTMGSPYLDGVTSASPNTFRWLNLNVVQLSLNGFASTDLRFASMLLLD